MKCYEAFESRDGGGDEITLSFIVDEVNDDTQALGHVFGVAPLRFRGLYRQSSKVKQKPLGHQTWKFDFPYTPVDPNEQGDEGGGEQSTDPFGIIDFDTTGGTQHITQCLEQADYGGEAAAPNIRLSRVIGLTKYGVEGVDIIVPQMEFTATKTYRKDAIDSNFILSLMNLTGKVNSAPFQLRQLTFLAGELLFVGCTGSSSGRKDWQMVYRFRASQNKKNIKIAENITVASKLGHEYLWVMYKVDEKDDRFTQVADVAFVSKVYDTEDFGPVLGVL